jgi:hypothetical protein
MKVAYEVIDLAVAGLTQVLDGQLRLLAGAKLIFLRGESSGRRRAFANDLVASIAISGVITLRITNVACC